MPVICPGETRVVGGFCACPGDMQVQSGNACACPAGFGIKSGGSTPIGRKERGLCERCPSDQGLTPDGYCAPSCPQAFGWVCLAPGGEANPIAQASNCGCMPLTPLVQTSDRGPAPSSPATVCPAPLFAFAGQCCTRDAIGTARCSAPSLERSSFDRPRVDRPRLDRPSSAKLKSRCLGRIDARGKCVTKGMATKLKVKKASGTKRTRRAGT
jgi:hypothetical protein